MFGHRRPHTPEGRLRGNDMDNSVCRQHRSRRDRADCEDPPEAQADLARPHGHVTVILLANIAPKLELTPFVKVCSSMPCALAAPSFGRWKSKVQAVGAPTSFTGSLSASLKSTKNVGSNTSSASTLDFTGAFSGKVKCSTSKPS